MEIEVKKEPKTRMHARFLEEGQCCRNMDSGQLYIKLSSDSLLSLLDYKVVPIGKLSESLRFEQLESKLVIYE